MGHETDASLAFCARPPSCLELLRDEKAEWEEVERVFHDEARNLQSRLREQVSQLKIELGLFLRLMYKNKNQHRRTLYYQRLSEVRRDMQMFSKLELDETVESLGKFFSAKRPDSLSSKAVTQSKFKDAIDERKALRTLLSVARLLNQSDGPIMAGSAQLAGLLGQSFFMPFALTMFSCLARFRVLLIQVLYEVVAAFNLLSTIWQQKQKSLIYSVQRKSVSSSVQGQTHLPAVLECHWDGTKLSVTEKKTASIPDFRIVTPDIPAEPSRLWFVDDRTGVKCDIQVPASIAGPSAEQLPIKSHVPLNLNQAKIMASAVEKLASSGPILEVQPDLCTLDPKADIKGLPVEDSTPAQKARDGVEDVNTFNLPLDPPGMSQMVRGGVTDLSGSRESSGQGQVGYRSMDYKHESRTSSAAKKSVAYRSISHRIVQDSTSSGNSYLQIGAKRKVADIGVDQKVENAPKPDFKKVNADSKDRSSDTESKEKKTNDIFAMLLRGSN
ncbi:unnamed protein product [Calypogeia fissa]